MRLYDCISTIFVAFGFVAWAVWGKSYGLHPAILGMMSTTLMALTVTLLSFSRLGDIGEKSFPSLESFAVMVFLCALNGIAFYVYSAKVASPFVKTGNYIVVVSVLMLVMARFLDLYLNNNSMSTLNGVGLATIILGIICFMR